MCEVEFPECATSEKVLYGLGFYAHKTCAIGLVRCFVRFEDAVAFVLLLKEQGIRGFLYQNR